MGDTQAWKNLVARILSDHFLGLIKGRTCSGPGGVQCNIHSFKRQVLKINLWCKGFYFPDKSAHLQPPRSRARPQLQLLVQASPWRETAGKVARLVRGLKDDVGAFWNYRAS